MNNLTLCGRVGIDPQVKEFESGKKSARFTLAIKQKKKGVEETMWVDVQAWDQWADRVMSFVRKGREVIVQGSLSMDKYDSTKEPGLKVMKPVVRLTGFTLTGSIPVDSGKASA